MSDYAARLSSLSEKKLRLIAEEKEIIERRKKEIGQLAQKFDLLTVSDDLIAGIFSAAQKSIADKADCVKEWVTLGGRFRKSGKARAAKEEKSGKPGKAKLSQSETAENSGVARQD